MNIKEQIEIDLQKAFEKLGFDKVLAVVSVSASPLCDYQCNASFGIAKNMGVKPFDIATQIAGAFKSTVAEAEAVNPAFINIRVTDSALEKYGNAVIKCGKLVLQSQNPRTIFFDYGGANIAKELHVGHLRSPIVGESLKRVFVSLGHKTLSDVYLGDWGLQNGLILAEFESRNMIKNGAFTQALTLDMFNEIYPFASKRKNTDTEFKKRCEEITLLMQQKKQPWFALWEQMRKISVAKIRENYDSLNCTFDFYKGESDAQPYVDTVLDILKQKKLAYDDKNCLIMDVIRDDDTAPMPPVILKKHNGGDLYATNDIATLYYRSAQFSPDEFIYLTDSRQNLHFEQVFRCVQKGGLIKDGTRLTHIGFGSINGTDGKPFKTRSGGTIKFEEIIDLVTEAAKKRLSPERQHLARAIGLSALKFADLSNNVKKDYVFDLDKFTSFEGKTGPYILYTIARINSILAKVGFLPKSLSEGFKIQCSSVTRYVLVSVCKLADSFATAAYNYTLNGITDASWALAAAFNLFYANTNILKETDVKTREGYIALCKLVRVSLVHAMDALAIETVEKM